MYILLAILLFVSVGSPANLIPRFKDYPVERIFAGSPAQPRFSSPAQLLRGAQMHENDLLPDADPRYRETVEYDAAHGPNFAGRYTISKWSCGTGCASIVVIDAVSGALYRRMPFGTLDINGNPASRDHSYAGLLFRKDSSLLVVEGCFDADLRHDNNEPPDCSRSYFHWISPRFKLLRKIPLPAPRWLSSQ